MSKRKATESLDHMVKKSNTSDNFVFYQSYRTDKEIKKVSSTTIGKRPIYRFFLDFDNQYFPLLCMLVLGRTSFVISPEAAKDFKIPVVK